MNIDLKDAETLIETRGKKLYKKLIALFILLLIAAVFAWVIAYCSESGKQSQIQKPLQSEEHVPKQEDITTNQHTEGDQSPAIVTNGDVNMDYSDANK